MSEENINIATKEYADAHFGNTSETNGDLVIATKEYVDSIPTGMVMDGTALKGQLCNHHLATTVGDGADGSALTNGTNMFGRCSGLTSWAAELPNLTNGSYMFDGCTSLTSWTVELPNLTNGTSMFSYCSGLTSFSGDLSKLAGTSSYSDGGDAMFYNCSKLTSFNSTLPALAYGQDMFYGCILDEASVLRILNSIPTYTSGTHKLHLGKRTNYQTSDKVAAKLRTSTGGTVTTPIAATIYRCVDDDGNDKGWTITVQA